MGHQSTILIVDDEPIGRDTLEALLFTQGYHLIFASDGPEALAKAAEFKPDIILLDVMMPGMDGFEVCQHLRADPLLAEVPIIMVTALDDQESRLQGIEAGADDFISKPFNRIELRARIKTITRLNRYRNLLLERTKFEWVIDEVDLGYLILTAEDEILYANAQARLYLSLPAGLETPTPEKFLTLAKKHYQCEPQEAWAKWPDRATGDSSRYLVQPSTAISDTFWLQVELIELTGRLDEKYLLRLRDVTTEIVERRAMWAFHAHVSHKLRTPLTLLDGFLEFFLEEDPGMSEAERNIFRPKIRKNAAQLQKNILDILQYTGVHDITGAGQELCSLAEIPGIIAKITATLGLESVKVTPPANDPVNAYLPLSAHALELILGELLENAQKFHPSRSPTLEVQLSRRPESLHLQVIDDGMTLSAEQLSKIWTPYYQAERGFSGQVPGMGLGLAMVASLIWSAGGTCRAYNRPEGPGLVIEAELPLLQADEIG